MFKDWFFYRRARRNRCHSRCRGRRSHCRWDAYHDDMGTYCASVDHFWTTPSRSRLIRRTGKMNLIGQNVSLSSSSTVAMGTCFKNMFLYHHCELTTTTIWESLVSPWSYAVHGFWLTRHTVNSQQHEQVATRSLSPHISGQVATVFCSTQHAMLVNSLRFEFSYCFFMKISLKFSRRRFRDLLKETPVYHADRVDLFSYVWRVVFWRGELTKCAVTWLWKVGSVASWPVTYILT